MFIKQSRKVHGKTYDYSVSKYLGAELPIKIQCQTHGVFIVKAGAHLNGKGACPKCARDSAEAAKSRRQKDLKRKTLYEKELRALRLESAREQRRKSRETSFKRKAAEIHNCNYDYSKVDYVNNTTRVEILCSKHGAFYQTPMTHLAGSGCPACVSGYSKKAIAWIEKEARSRRLKNVRHALNGGEFVIPGTRFRVDGYHERSKTIFEFHGDCFHGNPKIYTPRSKPNPYSTKTAKRLYLETQNRESHIRSLGYNLITRWESD